MKPSLAVSMCDAEGGLTAEQFSSLTKDAPKVMAIEKIMSILPHRYPFLLVDKLVEFEAGKRAVGVKQITANEPQFTGHFPGVPIMPGVLQVEALAQLGGLVLLQPPIFEGEASGGDFFFTGIDGVKFRKPVVPGDTLVLEMKLTAWREKFGIAKMEGIGYVDGVKVIEGKFGFAVVKNK